MGILTRRHAALAFISLSWTVAAYPQTYLNQVGSPTFVTPSPVERGYVNLANGDLHIEIPVAAAPQRGTVRFRGRLLYDSSIWAAMNNAWRPANVPNSWGGWKPGWIGRLGGGTADARSVRSAHSLRQFQ